MKFKMLHQLNRCHLLLGMNHVQVHVYMYTYIHDMHITLHYTCTCMSDKYSSKRPLTCILIRYAHKENDKYLVKEMFLGFKEQHREMTKQ